MLTLQYLPYSELAKLDSEKRIKKLLDIVRKERIILMEGRLKKEEETQLIQATMASIDDTFKGIEIAGIEADDDASFARRFMTNLIFGDRTGMTIIGPATIVKEIKKDPRKIELLMQESKKKRSTSASRNQKKIKKEE